MIVEEVVSPTRSAWLITYGGPVDGLISRVVRYGKGEERERTHFSPYVDRLLTIRLEPGQDGRPWRAALEFGKSFSVLQLGCAHYIARLRGGYLVAHVPVDDAGAYCRPPCVVSQDCLLTALADSVLHDMMHVDYVTCVVDLGSMLIGKLFITRDGSVVERIFEDPNW